MRSLKHTNQFLKDFKREKSGQLGKKLDGLLEEALGFLLADRPLPVSYKDHPLTGEWVDHRDCHIKPDLVLIYQKPDKVTLTLVRLGSHSELYG